MTRLGRADLDERFEVLATLGRGSYGVVHEVRDRRTGAIFALKLLTGQGELARTQRELEVSLQLEHPHVVRCFAGALTEDGGYLLLELCDGSLSDVLADRTQRHQAWELLAQTAEGLAALHARGLVHRDLKPSNVLLRGGRAKVADLGLVRGEDLGTMTEEGMVLGTPAFMSPEQARGDRVGPSGDVFALGVMLYDLVEGHLPYPDEPPLVLLARVARAQMFPLKRARTDLSGPALTLLEAMLDPEPGNRPTDLDAAARTLRQNPPRDLECPGEASVAARPLTRSNPRRRLASTAPRGLHKPRSAPRRSPVPLVFGAVVFAAVLGFLWPEAPPSPTEMRPGAIDTGPFPADYLYRLDRELAWATDQIVRPDGSLRSGADGPPGDGEEDLLTWDPHGYFQAMERLPEVQRFHTWIRKGGQPEALSPRLREGLQAVDAMYARRRFRRVFAPQLYIEPSPGEGPIAGAAAYPRDWPPLPEPKDPWRRAATEHLLRYIYAHQELEEHLHAVSRGDPSPAPESLARIFRAPVQLVTDLLERRALVPLMMPAWREPRNRARLGAWLAPASDHLERFFATAGRALESPGARKWMLWVTIGPLPTFDFGDLGPLAFAPPELLLGPLPDSDEGRFLLATLLRHQVHGLELLGHPVEHLRRRRAALLDGLLAHVDFSEPGNYGLHLVRMALHEALTLRDSSAYRRLFMAYLPTIVTKFPKHIGSVHGFVRGIRRLDDPLPFRSAELAALREAVAAAHPPPRGAQEPSALTLELLGQLVARAPQELALEHATR